MRRGEIWWVCYDPLQGTEIQKTRPSVIVSADDSNDILSRVQVVPVTSNTKKFYPSESPVIVGGKKGKAMANQLRTVDKFRLKSRIGKLSEREMADIEKAIKTQLELD